MPEIHNKTLHSFSSEDPQFPARNLLETKVTKKYKCEAAGEKSCFVVLKLDQPRVISGIDIGNEHSGFIEVLVGNSQQDPPVFKEILLATSFMTIVEAKNGTNPHRVRCFSQNALVESVAKQKWDLVKVFCSQPFNPKLKYGLSFVTLHTPEELKSDSPVKATTATPLKPSPVKVVESNEKKSKFGNFKLRASDEDSDDGKKKEASSLFSRWKSPKEESKPSMREQIKTKIEENRKRIRVMTDSSEEDDAPKANPKPNRNRTTGLVYEDEDDEPNEKLQKKLDKDKELKAKEQRTPKVLTKPDKSPAPSKFSSFVSDDVPSPSRSSKHSTSSPHQSSKHSSPSKRSSSSSASSSKPSFSKKTEKEPEREANAAPAKNITYKPFHQLLSGVTFVFSGYVNPERGNLRQKALDMGAKYKPDWDRSCTHLICAYSNTPKYQQVKGKGKIVTKRWIEACFTEQKRIPWRRYALDGEDKDEPESEEEVHNILKKPSPAKHKPSESGSDDDMVVVDKRKKNGDEEKVEAMEVAEDPPEVVPEAPQEVSRDVMDVSTDDEVMNGSLADLTQVENQIYKGKTFFLNGDLPAIDIIKLKAQITSMMGKLTEKPSRADYIISTGKNLPQGTSAEVLTSLWVFECHELEAFIPTTRYKPKHS